jgi:glycosyltransferase involved in cell wall biosynthesis
METTSPFFVSVIVPVYNGEQFLAQAIENIQQQNYQPLEIIVVDDGSTDGTAEIATQFKDQIRYVYQPNRGPSAARNRGIKMAAGDVIAFLDVDDLWPQNTLKSQLNCLASNPSVDVVQGFIQKMQLSTSAEGEQFFEPESKPHINVNVGSLILRKSVFEKVGFFDETMHYSEDTDYWLRLKESGISMMILNQVTLFYQKHQSNITNGKEYMRNDGFIMVLKRFLDRRRQKSENASTSLPFSFYFRDLGKPLTKKGV